MSGRRFKLLMRYLHLNNSEHQPPLSSPNYDKLYKIQPLLDLLIELFQSVYVLNREIDVDESIIGYVGRRSWIQYMLNKPTKWGIKTWVSRHGYWQEVAMYGILNYTLVRYYSYYNGC